MSKHLKGPKITTKKPDHSWKNIPWTAEIKINLYKNDGKKKVWRRLGTAHDPKHTTSSVEHGGAVWSMSCMTSSGTGLLLFSDDETEDRSSQIILKCVYYLPRFSQMEQSDWAALHSTNGRWPKTYSKSNPEFLKVKKFNILQWPSQSPDLNPSERAFHLLKTKLKAERPTNKQQLKSAAVKTWQSITH